MKCSKQTFPREESLIDYNFIKLKTFSLVELHLVYKLEIVFNYFRIFKVYIVNSIFIDNLHLK